MGRVGYRGCHRLAVSDNLEKWGTGGLRRDPDGRPFPDVVPSTRTPVLEREIAPHPSLKPQAFLRRIVWASLPLGKGIVLDPFCGSGSTLAAAEAIGYDSVGVEKTREYREMAERAIPRLAKLDIDPWVRLVNNGQPRGQGKQTTLTETPYR